MELATRHANCTGCFEEKGIQHLPLALGLGKHTFTTIKQNLSWAFIYNICGFTDSCYLTVTPPCSRIGNGFYQYGTGQQFH